MAKYCKFKYPQGNDPFEVLREIAKEHLEWGKKQTNPPRKNSFCFFVNKDSLDFVYYFANNDDIFNDVLLKKLSQNPEKIDAMNFDNAIPIDISKDEYVRVMPLDIFKDENEKYRFGTPKCLAQSRHF